MYTMLITKFDKSGMGAILFDDFIQCCVVLQVCKHAVSRASYKFNLILLVSVMPITFIQCT